MINWKVRIKNKNFWLAAVPALLLAVQAVLALFGVDWAPDILSDKLIDIINTVFTLLAIMGVVTDPTTVGIGDSRKVLEYDEPSVGEVE